MKQYIDKLANKQNLNRDEAAELCRLMLATNTPSQVAELLTLLHVKGETSDEICGFVDVMQQHMKKITHSTPAIDIVGTGGDGANTVNISTAASIVTASCGATVIKNGNRSSSSKCGSADYLERAGIALDAQPDQIARCIAQTQYGFCFAPTFHPAFAQFKELRQQLKIRTIFNLIGPLLNPARVQRLVLGVYKPELLELYANALSEQGIERALVVHGSGLDELNCLGVNQAIEVHNGQQTTMTIDPKQLGLAYCQLSDLQGGDADKNVRILNAVLSGEQMGAIADTVALNAGAALYVYGSVSSLKEGVEQALSCIQSGRPAAKLQEIATFFSEEAHA
ncbi:MAG: anthranilate phosphoribosyltransferase [Coxiella sp. (in: Bacteria)]|nr:MAG: anthranilate phosphoribosyltransferase [Coxiella sp. (in: g-proteobacteria)]